MNTRSEAAIKRKRGRPIKEPQRVLKYRKQRFSFRNRNVSDSTESLSTSEDLMDISQSLIKPSASHINQMEIDSPPSSSKPKARSSKIKLSEDRSASHLSQVQEHSGSRASLGHPKTLPKPDTLACLQAVAADVMKEYNDERKKHFQTILNSQLEKMTTINEARLLANSTLNIKDGQSELATKIRQSAYFVVIYEGGKRCKKPVKVPLTVMPSGKERQVPRGWFYLHAPKSIATRDANQLSHVPYMSDRFNGDPVQFELALMESFPDGVHGQYEHGNTKAFINDRMMYQIVVRCIPKLQLNISEQLPQDLVDAILYEFPNIVTASEITDLWLDCVHSYGDELVQNKVVNICITPNIDNDNHEQVQSISEVMSSYRSIFCRRCLMYDCLTHVHDPQNDQALFEYRDYPQPEAEKALTIRKKRTESDDKLPCGDSCYLHEKKVQKSLSPKKSPRKSPQKYAQKKTLSDLIVDDGWSNRDQSMLKAVRIALNDDNCAIARAFYGAKTCSQVARFIAAQPKEIREPVYRLPMEALSRHVESSNEFRDAYRRFRLDRNDEMDLSTHYHPCHHPGITCDDAQCDCYLSSAKMCFKWCRCTIECRLRFPGCRCEGGCQKSTCACYFAKIECDPDICIKCGAGDLSCTKCGNVNIQRNLKQNLMLGKSDVAGWGLFAPKDLSRGTYLCEYTGEIVTTNEAERRGKVYDACNLSYLFNINDALCDDAMSMGNKMRFANHSTDHPNCEAATLVVNGEHRIGIWAKTDLRAGEELYFNYAYSGKHVSKFVSKERIVVANRRRRPPRTQDNTSSEHSRESSCALSNKSKK